MNPGPTARLRQLLGHGTKFGRKKEEAVAALLSHRNLEEAARAIGVVPNTLLRWMKEPEFDSVYRAAKRATVGQAIARLHQGSSAAAMTLLKLMRDSTTPPSTWARCAESVLSLASERSTGKKSNHVWRRWRAP